MDLKGGQKSSEECLQQLQKALQRERERDETLQRDPDPAPAQPWGGRVRKASLKSSQDTLGTDGERADRIGR